MQKRRMEIIMSQSQTYADGRIGVPRQSFVASVGAALERWAAAYMLWRIERVAIAQLEQLSDRELADIGLVRVDIPFAVKTQRVPGRAAQD
jgi:uncharacterized protein YjiS (DUF1127 family)